jgi:putative ABC transport system permease protein
MAPDHRFARWLAAWLPRDIHTRIFEPAFEDARAEGLSSWRVLLLVFDCYRLAGLTIGHRRRYLSQESAPRATFMDTIAQDLRFAARMLTRQPGFTSVAVLSLALGIGANASIFALIYGLFVRPLPYQEPARLVRLWGQSVDGRLTQLAASTPRFEHIRDHQQSASAVAADFGLAMSLSGGAEAVRVNVFAVTANYFDVLGVRPSVGRVFRPEEEGRANAAIVTHDFWMNRLQSTPTVIGASIALDGVPYTIVGVVDAMPRSDVGPAEVFVTRPYELSGVTPELRQRGVSFLRITARLKPGVTVEQARAEAAILGATYQQANREKADSSWRERLVPIREDLTGSVRPAILTLFAAVALVLLIACSNVANLLTARFTGRRREIALRGALGAGVGRIVRLFLIESVMLSAAGAAAGVALAAVCLRALPSIGAVNLPLDADVTVTGPVLWATLAVALITGVLMGLYPAIQAARPPR